MSLCVSFDIAINSKLARRIVFKLYDDVAPKTARNFRGLATGQHGFGYAGSSFYRVIPQFMLQGDDFTHSNGTGGKSIHGAKFPGACTRYVAPFIHVDENLVLKHSKPRLLSMATAGSMATIVFGEVVEGMDVVKAVEAKGPLGGKKLLSP
ncbi:hypothetical protein K435DRAFT_877741 [Dendrothele bispora CBS 962.96]|uniref:Peptidyl-prolyl cis-trans isomerase n=1 Tax=Dendrothele bispora (strain CBS 962.96) TaxID=1314807 RepID=A0A4S8KQB5_DENBC|nr:hypothetical protein K435DRAFT_877741 [Dendrothele bispora CBS 962.96]